MPRAEVLLLAKSLAKLLYKTLILTSLELGVKLLTYLNGRVDSIKRKSDLKMEVITKTTKEGFSKKEALSIFFIIDQWSLFQPWLPYGL